MHAIEEAPNACCGILAGKGESVAQVYCITNLASKLRTTISREASEILNATDDTECQGLDSLAFYHCYSNARLRLPLLPSGCLSWWP